MSRRRRTLSILVLLTFLLSLWAQPLIAREPPSGPEDWQYSTLHEDNFGMGDDDDDGANISNTLQQIWKVVFINLYLIYG